MPDFPVALVVAVAENNVIGNEGGMPWKLSTDLKRFKRDTIGKPIIMGRKTFDSIGKPLPGRLNIVISRSPHAAEGTVHATSLDSALFIAEGWARENGADEICVIGGGQIYEMAMPVAERLYVTHVLAKPDGDTRFPVISGDEWQVVCREEVPKGEKDSVDTVYTVYDRIKAG